MLSIIKAALKTGLGSVGGILFGVIGMKIFAVFLGPNGVGLFSILRQTTQTGLVVATIGGQTALIQGIASHKEEAQQHYIACVCGIFIISSLLVSSTIAWFAQPLALLLLGSDDNVHTSILYLLAFAIFSQSWTVYTASILNGFGAIGKLAFQQVVATSVVALFAYPASTFTHLHYGLLLAVLLVLSSLCSLLYGLIMVRRLQLSGIPLWRPRWHKASARHFFSIATTTVMTTLLNTGSVLLIRMMLVESNGLTAAGYFDTAWTVSMTYVMLILSSLSTYYMPKLSQIQQPEQQQLFMRQVLRFVLFAMLPIVSLVIIGKPLIIQLLYTDDFNAALTIIRWMLIGDFFKALTWVLTMPMLSYAHMRLFFWFQFIWNICFVGLAYVSLYHFDSMENIGLAFFVLNFVILIPAFIYTKKVMNFLPNALLWLQLVIASIFLGLISWWTWNDNQVDWFKFAITLMISLGLVISFISKTERQFSVNLVKTKLFRFKNKS